MRADGYSLDQKRNEIPESDIPDIVARFGNLDAEADRSRTEQSFLVPSDEIREHNYDLAFNSYKETVREAVVYDAPEVILDRATSLYAEIGEGMDNLKRLIAKSHEA